MTNVTQNQKEITQSLLQRLQYVCADMENVNRDEKQYLHELPHAILTKVIIALLKLLRIITKYSVKVPGGL